MNERIKEVRKRVNLNQVDFGARIGVRQGTIACYENGSRTPLDPIIMSICREFNVNETWLRTGEGTMFTETPETTLDALTVEFNLTELEQRIISGYLHLSEGDRMVIQKWIQNAVEEITDSEPQKPQTVEEVEAEYIKTMSELARKQEHTALSSTDADITERIS